MSSLFAISEGLMNNKEKTDKTTMKSRDEIQITLVRTGESAFRSLNK